MEVSRLLKPLVDQLYQEVFKYLPESLYYHNFEHTQLVITNALLLAKQAKLSVKEERLLYAAAALHDTGYGKQYLANEGVGAILAERLLPNYGFSRSEIQMVGSMILATNTVIQPETHLEMLLSDADMAYLGQPEFLIWSNRLLCEWRLHGQYSGTNKDWLERQRAFLQGHQYRTTEANALFSDGKLENIAALKNLSEWPF